MEPERSEQEGDIREAESRAGEATVFHNLVDVRRESGDLDGARVAYAQALALYRELGNNFQVKGFGFFSASSTS